MSTDPNSLEARNKVVDEHVQAEVERDRDKIMETWGENPAVRHCPKFGERFVKRFKKS